MRKLKHRDLEKLETKEPVFKQLFNTDLKRGW